MLRTWLTNDPRIYILTYGLGFCTCARLSPLSTLLTISIDFTVISMAINRRLVKSKLPR